MGQRVMNCSDCLYGRMPGQSFSNSCYRYPDPERVASEHWCGEWSDIEVQLARFVKHVAVYEDADRTYYGADAIQQHRLHQAEKPQKPILGLPKRK